MEAFCLTVLIGSTQHTLYRLTFKQVVCMCVRSQKVFTKMHAIPHLEFGLPKVGLWMGRYGNFISYSGVYQNGGFLFDCLNS